jgi:signal transduction histidine kinase
MILLLCEPFLIRRIRALTYIYLIVQTIIISALAMIAPNVDFWGALFCPLIVQTMHNFPQRTGFIITGIFAVIMAIFMFLGLGLEVGLPLIFFYGVVYFLLAAFIAIIKEAESARDEIQRQKAELEEAHQQLQLTTANAEELAVVKERNRLARELHDSVTQSLYSLTLFTEAVRHMAEEAGEKGIEQYIEQIGVIGQQALKEMRLLVYELQPIELGEVGLARALRNRLEAVEGRAGVEARLEMDELDKLPPDVEKELFRIALEALNNSLKHANAGSITVYLRQPSGMIEMEIVDDGLGFNPQDVIDQGGSGLKNIHERSEQIDGKASIHSQPGEGTTVKVTLPRIMVENQKE